MEFRRVLFRSHMGGAASPLPLRLNARLAAPLPATGARDDFLRAYSAEEGIVSVTSQDSAATAAMALAACLIWRPASSEDRKSLVEGKRVPQRDDIGG